MTEPLVSVVVPVFNGADYLGEALESLCRQTYPNVETIVVNDGSSDASGEIAKQFDRIIVLEQENAGVSTARNVGVAASSGEYVAFLDHDDRWDARKLELQVAVLQSRPEVGLVLCHRRNVVEGEIPAWVRGPTDGSAIKGFVPSCWLLRRSTFDLVGLFDPQLHDGEDYEWLRRAMDAGVESVMLDDVLVDYRVHGGNRSAHVAAGQRNMFKYLRESIARRRDADE